MTSIAAMAFLLSDKKSVSEICPDTRFGTIIYRYKQNPAE